MLNEYPPVLLIHAFPLNREVWEPVRQLLRERGVEAHSLDLLGFGDRSCERPSVEPTLDAFGDQVAAWIRRTGSRTVLAGLSLGGYVALNVLRRTPELVAGIALIDSKAGADDEAGIGVREEFAKRVDDEGASWVAAAMREKLLGHTSLAERPDVVAAVTKMIDSTSAETIAWTQRAMACRPDSLSLLADYAEPILVAVGEEDSISTVTESAAVAAAIPGSTFAVIPGAGHLSPLEDPQAVTDVIAEWLLTARRSLN